MRRVRKAAIRGPSHDMQVSRQRLSGVKKESTFALYAKQSFTILSDAIVGILVERQVGRNG